MKSIYRKSRITNPFNPSALGRPVFCLRKSHAGNATVLDFPVENLRPCSQVNATLYGLRENQNK